MVVGLAIVLAIVAGARVARDLLSSEPAPAPASSPVIVFHETVTGTSIAYPSSWRRQPTSEPGVALLAAANASTSLLVRVTVTGLDDITSRTLPLVREYTDPQVLADKRVKLLGDPQPIELGGLPGWRYRYSYGAGAHDHYFLFKRGRMISLVFQARPASRLTALTPRFNRIAATFRGTVPR